MSPRYQPQELADLLNQAAGLEPAIKLTAEQAEVIGSPVGSALVVAGAGSGKTLVMALRVVYLVANGLARQEEILGLTFTRKAAAELSQRIRRLLSLLPQAAPRAAEAGWPTVSTYNAYAAGIVRNWGLQLGVDPDARVMSEAQRWSLAHQLVEAWDDDPDPRPSAGALTARLLAVADQCSDNEVSGERLASSLNEMVSALLTRHP
ncbi:MAG: UvrD-helicase domain-containing protein, partial [Bifidobacteriaceae bacterium]|nr:UvrD-helicase domain-containing protein [Bifidobacteriaceae bacterium]